MIRLLSRYPLVWLSVFLAAAAIVAFNREGTVPEATAARVSAMPAVSKPAARPIETIQVGQRVLARNPEVTSAQRAVIQEPVWESWLQISLVMPVGELPSDPNQPPAILSIEILRPESWLQDEIGFELTESADFASVAYAPLRSSQADASLELEPAVDDLAADSPQVPLSPLRPIFRDIALVSLLAEEAGYEVAALTVDMNLPEMGAVGLAVITNIQPCPAIEQAEGEVVTATFAHPPTHQVLDVSFEGEAKPIGVTSNHPFWSADRQCFLPIGEMAVGDRVITYAGATKRIESLLPRPGPETVFNLEVYGEHVYYVGGQGLLVHNAYPPGRLTFVSENLGTPKNAKKLAARDFDSGTVGAFSDVSSKQRVVPALLFDNPKEKGAPFVKFDGYEELKSGITELIDSKTRIVPFATKKGGPFISKSVEDGLTRKSLAIKQNPGFSAVLEFPTKAARREAQQVLRSLRIKNISTRVRQ